MKPAIRVFLALLVLTAAALAANREGYYRYPAIHGQTIVFTSEGDLWCASSEGGLARRLTSHPGMESRAAISPDGLTVAFVGQYEGPDELYTMPIGGGLPVRRTFTGASPVAVGWTTDGNILYSTQRYSTLPNTQLVVLNPGSQREEIVPLSQASEGCIDASGRTLFFTRLPFQGSFTKRYRGGTVQNIWKWAWGKGEAVALTSDYPGTSKNPMLFGGRVYFLCDRDGRMNLWSMTEDGKNLVQHTFHKELDASSPSLQGGRIVYQLVADLRLFDIASGQDRRLDISLSSDFDQMREKWVSKPMEYLTSVHLSPSGDRLALTARGQVFVAPAVDGRWIRITRQEGVRSRSARFFPDGRSLLVLTDGTGEWEFHRFPANGVGQPEQLTWDGAVIRFDGFPSPDGKWLAFTDKNYELWVHDLVQKKSRRLAVSQNAMQQDFSWSPGSRWLAYIQAADNQYEQLMVFDTVTGAITALTSDRVDCGSPAWSQDGKWLYFISDRTFQSLVPSPWGARQPEPYFDKTAKVYALAFDPGARFSFLPENELQAKPAGEVKPAPGEAQKKASSEQAAGEPDWQALRSRLYEVPIAAGLFANLAVGDKYLLWQELGTAPGQPSKLQAIEFKSRGAQVKTLMEGISSFELSQDGKKILVRKGEDFYVFDAGLTPPNSLEEKKTSLGKWSFSIDPRQEWRQMLVDAWRMERDYFYDRNLHGVDYAALLQRHIPYLDRVSDRTELSDLIAHLVGELSALHTFVRGGDLRRSPENVVPDCLGALLLRDDAASGYRVAHIYQADPDYPERLSPLARPEVKVAEGEVITAINGVPALSVAHPGLLLRQAAGQQVLLTVTAPGNAARESGTRQVIVVPITSAAEADMRYEDWEYSRRLAVEKAGGGQIGYLHLRAMGSGNYSEWVKNFYPVFDRQGLIIDVRHNRGGNIDSWILEKLQRKAWFYWKARAGKPYWNMQYAFRGHVVVVCDEFTASDGEAFAEGFRRLGLGMVIGMRTWGGEIWLSQSNLLVDRGIASAAEMGVYGPEGAWLIEGHGVEPDMVVDNLPAATFRGGDAQLEAALRYLQDKIKKEPNPVPAPPPYPDQKKK